MLFTTDLLGINGSPIQISINHNDEEYSQVQTIAQDIRTEVVDSTQYTVSIDIGSNKFQAKIATDQVKPDGCFVIVPDKL